MSNAFGVNISVAGSFKNINDLLNKSLSDIEKRIAKKYGELGRKALMEATPKDRGITADSWYYDVYEENGAVKLGWYNTSKGGKKYTVKIAMIIDKGHATKNGGWIEGLHYIDPAIQPIFEEMSKKIWMEVTKNG